MPDHDQIGLDRLAAVPAENRLAISAFIAMCSAVLWNVPASQALDNLDGNDYGAIGPVMDYDPVTGTSSPFFPIGWYFFWPTDNVLLDEVLASGGNTVLFADCKDDPSWLWSNAIAGLNRAQQLGLKIIIGLDDALWTGIDCKTPPARQRCCAGSISSRVTPPCSAGS